MTKVTLFVVGALCGAAILAGFGVLFPDSRLLASEEIKVVDGKLWLESTVVEQRAYLVGVGNMISVEKLYQEGAKTAPTDDQSTIQRFWKGLDLVTLEGAEQAISKWYRANPGKQGEPVIVVAWQQIVEPRLAELEKKQPSRPEGGE